ncbi:hypothetical protein PT974_05936 [Cladobotryum mycophilum]|uniref:Uncharacterized protein n=1 Tax=Cladobotryum mycophilum TaxID=491253 RepID=A0ABR0SLA0_9HYPO
MAINAFSTHMVHILHPQTVPQLNLVNKLNFNGVFIIEVLDDAANIDVPLLDQKIGHPQVIVADGASDDGSQTVRGRCGRWRTEGQSWVSSVD